MKNLFFAILLLFGCQAIAAENPYSGLVELQSKVASVMRERANAIRAIKDDTVRRDEIELLYQSYLETVENYNKIRASMAYCIDATAGRKKFLKCLDGVAKDLNPDSIIVEVKKSERGKRNLDPTGIGTIADLVIKAGKAVYDVYKSETEAMKKNIKSTIKSKKYDIEPFTAITGFSAEGMPVKQEDVKDGKGNQKRD